MGTRSTVGYVDTKGNVKAVYCHWDGYPEHMVYAIETFISMHGVTAYRANIAKALREGGMRQFLPYAIETFGTKDEDNAGWLYERNDIDAGQYQEYCYLVDKTGKIAEFYDHDGRQTIETMRKHANGERE